MDLGFELYDSRGHLAIEAIPQELIDGLDAELRQRFEAVRRADAANKADEAEVIAAKKAHKEATSLQTQRTREMKKFAPTFHEIWKETRG
jgi:gentisate 1,2-dioxygenase